MSLPVLLIPGLNCTPRIYADYVPDLQQAGPVTVADTGTGETMAQIASAILAGAPPSFALAGFSMGGYLAFEILRQARDRVERLALLDTSARPDTAEQSAKRRTAIAQTEAGDFDGVLNAQFPNLVHKDHAGDESLRQTYVAMGQDAGAKAFVRHSRAIMARLDSRDDLPKIKCRTLVLVGEGDLVTPPDAAREMADGIAGAKLVTVSKAGHLSLLEQPAAVRAALLDWIA